MLTLKSVSELLGEKFHIPAYQRGYRWTDTQVRQLLEDVWEFCKKGNDRNKGEFYCLQPVVVKGRGDGEWEVIDGQQRLTTIYILLKYLEDTCKAFDRNFRLYSIQYSTRPKCAEFLENIKNSEAEHVDNIDFYGMKNAYRTIKLWFENETNNINIGNFTNTLIMKPQIEPRGGKNIDVSNNVRVIWYDAGESDPHSNSDPDSASDNSIDIFTRLNIGKIPLTNAELIKALFLRKRSDIDEKSNHLNQILIASEWDWIEKTLQGDDFWHFIGKGEKYGDNRIEYIFDLITGRNASSEDYHTYNKYVEKFAAAGKDNGGGADDIWYEVKKYFLTFEEWFRDHELFHYIGFLIECGMNARTIKNESEKRTKRDFKEIYLKDEIREKVRCDDIAELSYGNNNDMIRKILLLFNIQTILELDTQKSDTRFSFYKYRTKNWHIEHVRSQTGPDADNIPVKNRREWLKDVLEYFTDFSGWENAEYMAELREAIEKTDGSERDICSGLADLFEISTAAKAMEAVEFDELFARVAQHFKENTEDPDMDCISNLTLLDERTNCSYKNAFFPIKRKRIIKNDKNGVFVPIATKNLFLKYYTKKPKDLMYWYKNDATDYLSALRETLKEFLKETEES